VRACVHARTRCASASVRARDAHLSAFEQAEQLGEPAAAGLGGNELGAVEREHRPARARAHAATQRGAARRRRRQRRARARTRELKGHPPVGLALDVAELLDAVAVRGHRLAASARGRVRGAAAAAVAQTTALACLVSEDISCRHVSAARPGAAPAPRAQSRCNRVHTYARRGARRRTAMDSGGLARRGAAACAGEAPTSAAGSACRASRPPCSASR
jgi:hypothetical protein